MKILRLAFLLFAVTLPLFAQVTVNVHVVEVPVTVVSHDGNPVRGLTKGNFELYDDGKLQSITSFDAIDFASTATVSAISPLNANARRSFLLLFDLGYSDIKSIARARVAAKQFIEANVKPRDLMAVGYIDPERGFRLLTAFTTDRGVVEAAIANPKVYRGPDPLQLSDVDALSGVSGAGSTSGRGAEADAELSDTADRSARENRGFVGGRVQKEVDALGVLATTLRSVPGRKQVILLSGGFDAAAIRGRNARGSMGSDLKDMAKATSGQAYLIDNDARFGNTASQNVLGDMITLFKQSDVILHAIDIAGIRVDGDTGPVSTVSNDSLHMLADPTGGTVFENSNDIRMNFEKLMRQQEVVYVLGFHAAAVSPGKLHNLSVKLVNAPSATVHNRVAYYESGAQNSAERILSNAEIIVNDIAQPDIKLAALAAAVPKAGRAEVPFFLEINGADLLRGATKPFRADIFVYAFDEQGVVRDRLYQVLDLDPAKASERVKANGLKYCATLALPPGHYAIKSLVAIRETEKRGFVRTDLVVPGATDLAVMPPLFIDKPGAWALIKGTQHGSDAYPFVLEGQPFVPSAMPNVKTKGQFALFLYNANPEELMMQTTVTDASGTSRFATPSLVRQIRGDGVTKLVFDFEPLGVKSGPAKLDLLIHKKGSPDMRHAIVPLIVSD